MRATARQLGIAQPALTRSIRQLEQELGVALFDRRAHGVALTQAGKQFVERASLALAEIQRAREEIAQSKGDSHGSVSACLSTIPHLVFLPHVLGPFRRRFPHAKLRLIEGLFPTVENAIHSGAIDFYMGPTPFAPLPRDLVEQRLFDNEIIVIARKGHPLMRARQLKSLAAADWVSTSVTDKDEMELDEIFETHGLSRPNIIMQAHSALTVITSVANSDVLAIVPEQWLGFQMARDLVTRIPIREKLTGLPFSFVHRANLAMTPAAEFFCDLLREQCAKISRKSAA